MTKIKVLPEILANKIAAGEIVERPASAVKELIENSIDANASSIHIAIASGGKRSIIVRDDGEGMSQDDAILAFEHHATSKLQSAEDLSAIKTLGFRGEALPSIASISRLTLKTRQSLDSAAISGTEIEFQGGVLRSVKPIAWDKGTEVTVRDLFFNVPARRKFLRSHDTELSHITRLATHYALAHPEIRFTFESEGRVLMDAMVAGSVQERIYHVFGDKFLDNLVEFSGQAGSVRIHGFCSRPHEQRTNPNSQFFYVNRRMVRDKVIAGAIRQGYRNCMPASAYPVIILFLELPFADVDVNAHPAKTEIRFCDQNTVYRLVLNTIEEALTRNASAAVYDHYETAGISRENIPSHVPAEFAPDVSFQGPTPLDFNAPIAALDPLQKAFNYRFSELPPVSGLRENDHHSLRIMPEMLYEAQRESSRPFQTGQVRILGQLHDSYIIACDNQGLLIVDQHVAHERILYEKMAAAMRNSNVEIQGLLVPVALDLPPHQAATLDLAIPELGRNGFHIERFGGNSILIRSVPAAAKELDCHKLIAEILEGLEISERTLDVDRIRDKIAVSTACRAAIKVHMPLTMEKMQWLLDELSLTHIPTNCPHGRPIVLRFSTYEIERNFGRI